MKKLIPAICLLLITAMVLGTSTYAWFTTNDSVSANDLQLRAKTGENLLIGTTSELAQMSESIQLPAFEETNAAMKPISTKDLTNWYQATAAAVGSEEPTAGALETATPLYAKTFYLWSASASDIYMSGLTVKRKTGNAGTDADWTAITDGMLFNSLRIGIKYGDDYCIYAPFASTANGSPIAGDGAKTGTDATAVAIASDSTTSADTKVINPSSGKQVFHAVGTNDDKYVAFSLQPEVTAACTVYVWFEGTDGACFTNNFTTDMIKVSFTLNRATPAAAEEEEKEET